LNRFLLTAFALLLILIVRLPAALPQISQDRELKEFDLTNWDCLNRPEGSARTPDGIERNRQKNRSAPTLPIVSSETLDTPAFLKRFAEFDAQIKGRKRSELNPAEREQLDSLERQILHLTGYLVSAYCGPPETTNCKSIDWHDWHLELFEKPQDHAPQRGDPTPIVCEITPRTQNSIFHDGVRIQELTAFVRPPDPHLPAESTGHAAQKIRVTGYLMWDDEHNGAADVGPTIRKIAANGYHQPWRSTAWEIHPVVKIERADNAPAKVESRESAPPPARSPAVESSSPAVSTPVPTSPSEQLETPASTPPRIVIVTQPVKIKIPYGDTVLPPGTKLPIVSRDAQTVAVQYMAATYTIPITSTDLR
jgi:hypothetical protein